MTDNSAPAATSQSLSPKFEDALAYLASIKSTFPSETATYSQFLGLMNDFRLGTLDIPSVIKRVHELFACHPKLIEGFNVFIPQNSPDHTSERSVQQDVSLGGSGAGISGAQLYQTPNIRICDGASLLSAKL